jgi:ParB-like chromosome segregation protein Spo0J
MRQEVKPVLQDVPCRDITRDDQTFSVTYRPALQALRQSVARMGVLTPLHLRRVSAQMPLQVVCGTKRLQVCEETGQDTVPALVYSATELPDEPAFLLAVYDNLGCRALNAVEKGRILRRLQADFRYAPTRLLEEFCPLLDLPPRLESVAAYCTLTTLDDALQAAVVAERLPLETALWIGQQAPEDRQALVGLFTGLKLGVNRAREFTAAIEDMCRRDRCGAAALLHRLGVSVLGADAQLAEPQKVERLRRLLHEARYPLFSAHEQRFQETLRRLRLPASVSLRPPPYFEGQHYQVSFTFRTRQELQQAAQRLLEAATNAAIDDLLTLL